MDAAGVETDLEDVFGFLPEDVAFVEPYKGIPTGARVPTGVSPDGDEQFVATFSIRARDLAANTKLQVAVVGPGPPQVLYSIKLSRITKDTSFRGTESDDENGTPITDRGVTFDDFVFTIDVDVATKNNLHQD